MSPERYLSHLTKPKWSDVDALLFLGLNENQVVVVILRSEGKSFGEISKHFVKLTDGFIPAWANRGKKKIWKKGELGATRGHCLNVFYQALDKINRLTRKNKFPIFSKKLHEFLNQCQMQKNEFTDKV